MFGDLLYVIKRSLNEKPMQRGDAASIYQSRNSLVGYRLNCFQCASGQQRNFPGVELRRRCGECALLVLAQNAVYDHLLYQNVV